jgi:hypothetical protein
MVVSPAGGASMVLDMDNVILKPDELKVLAFLHETTLAYDSDWFVTLPEIDALLGPAPDPQVKYALKIMTYLRSWGLVLRDFENPHQWYFTGQGENFMRHVDRGLEENSFILQGEQLTVSKLDQFKKDAKDFVLNFGSQVLAQLACGYVGK